MLIFQNSMSIISKQHTLLYFQTLYLSLQLEKAKWGKNKPHMDKAEATCGRSKKASSGRGVAVETPFIACCPAVKSTLGRLNRGGGLHQGGGWQEVLIFKLVGEVAAEELFTACCREKYLG